jgi:exopolysaccharide biosynthesis polyprenyl glycosylphosphotransferase
MPIRSRWKLPLAHLAIQPVSDSATGSLPLQAEMPDFAPTRAGVSQRKLVLVVGTGPRARELAARLEQSESIYVFGFLDDEPHASDREKLGGRYRGRLGDLVRIAVDAPIEHVFFALPRRFLGLESTANLVSVCDLLGIGIDFPLDLFETRGARLVIDTRGPVPTFRLCRPHQRGRLLLKRSLDWVGALALLLTTWPLWIAAALAIRLESAGPVFFVQRRCGRFGRVFPCLKFRTMVVDAEGHRAALEDHNEQSGPVFKMRNDPRVTRVGRVLRRYSIDELPQLINVLVGHMSLVGPRPPLPAEVERYELHHRARLSVRPGLTCLWQVSGRSDIGFEQWMDLDLQYIDRWSIWLDLKILLKTIPAVISARGAA